MAMTKCIDIGKAPRAGHKDYSVNDTHEGGVSGYKQQFRHFLSYHKPYLVYLTRDWTGL